MAQVLLTPPIVFWHRCTCGHCQIMTTQRESICCKEVDQIKELLENCCCWPIPIASLEFNGTNPFSTQIRVARKPMQAIPLSISCITSSCNTTSRHDTLLAIKTAKYVRNRHEPMYLCTCVYVQKLDMMFCYAISGTILKLLL